MAEFSYVDGVLRALTPPEIVVLEAVRAQASAVQLRALSAAELINGLLHLNITPDMVDVVIAGLPEPDRTIAKWRWERSQVFMRGDWLIADMAAAFGKSAEEVDAAWLYAQQ